MDAKASPTKRNVPAAWLGFYLPLLYSVYRPLKLWFLPASPTEQNEEGEKEKKHHQRGPNLSLTPG